jgi:hypothetical protein
MRTVVLFDTWWAYGIWEPLEEHFARIHNGLLPEEQDILTASETQEAFVCKFQAPEIEHALMCCHGSSVDA